MESLVLINGKGKRFKVDKPIECSDSDMTDWIFSQMQEKETTQGNRLKNYVMGKLNYIKDLKCKR